MNEYKEIDIFDGYYDFTVGLNENFDAVDIYTYSDFLKEDDFGDIGHYGREKNPATELYKREKYEASKLNATFSYFKNKDEVNWIWQKYLRKFVDKEIIA